MKTLAAICLLAFMPMVLFAQDIQVRKGVADAKAIVSLKNISATSRPQQSIPGESYPVKRPPKQFQIPSLPGNAVITPDNANPKNIFQSSSKSLLSPGPTANFAGLGDNNAAIPPDVHGAASPNHLMITLNTEVRIQNTSGTVLSTVALTSFWSSFTFSTIFDPRVHYDPYSNRWITVVVIDRNSATSSLLIAVSATANPTGTWYMWQVDIDATNSNWFDYPTVGFNKNWIVVSGNVFTNVGNMGIGVQIYAFDKSNLYSNGTGAFTLFSLAGSTSGYTIAPAATYDPNLHNLFLLQSFNGNFSGFGYLSLYKIAGAVGSETLTQLVYPATPNPWAWQPAGGADFAPQLGATNKIQLNDDKMQNTVYRNGSLWCTHHIFLPAASPTRSAIQWWQLDTVGTILQRGRVDDVSGNNFYAYPSIAVNSGNNVLIGYNSFSLTQYASANYSYRQSSDAANTLQSPYIYKSGLASYYKIHGGTLNRWGDFSATVVDPTNDLDFWTLQEYAELPVATIDRWGTWWAKVTCQLPPNPGPINQPTVHCMGQPAWYSIPTVSGATSYLWTILGTGWSGSSTTDSILVTAGTVPGNVAVAAVNSCGTGPASNVNVFPFPIPTSFFTVSNDTTLTNQPIVITGTANPAASYAWDFDGGIATPGTGIGPHNVHWITSGAKYVKLTVTENGCTSTQTIDTIQVNCQLPPNPGPITQPPVHCAGQLAWYSIPPVAGATSYLWTILGTGWSGSSTTDSILVTAGTVQGNISAAAVDSCGTGQASNVNVTPFPIPTSFFTVSNDTVFTNQTTTITGTANPAASYAWDFDGGVASPGTGIGPHNVYWASAGAKYVKLIVTENTCVSPQTVDTIQVNLNIGINMMSIEKTKFLIYPNPFQDRIVVQAYNPYSSLTATISITNQIGQVVYYANKLISQTNETFEIPVDGLASGIFLFTIQTERGVSQMKIIKVD